MTRTTPFAVLALAAFVVTAPMAMAAPSAGTQMFDQETETPTATPDGNATVAPGEQLSGVVGVQAAEIEGEVAERTFGVQMSRANSSSAKASVVAAQVEDIQARIDQLEQRQQTLQEARANGSISEGEYRAQMATVAAELSTARRLANASENAAQGLPADVLEANGVNVTAIQTLQDRAANLTGPEVAEIAQSIAGSDVGRSMAGAQRPSEVGQQIPGGAPNGTDGAPTDAPGGQDGAPNGTDAPGGQDGQGGAPNGTDGGAPNGTDGGAPNGTEDGTGGAP